MIRRKIEEQPSEDTVNYQKLHYDKHIEFFMTLVKVTGAAITIMVSIALYLTYDNMKDIREDFRKDMAEIKNDAKTIKDEAKINIKETQDELYKQVPRIKDDAEDLALTAVRRTIREEFEANNIRALVEQTANEKLSQKFDVFIEKKIQVASTNFDEQMRTLSRATIDVNYAVEQMRFGSRKGLRMLDSLRLHSPLATSRELAATALARKKIDYEQAYRAAYTSNDTLFISNSNDTSIFKNFDKLVNHLIRTINTEEDLNSVCTAIFALRKVTDEQFDMFDFKSINYWFNTIYQNAKGKFAAVFQKKKLKILPSPVYFILTE